MNTNETTPNAPEQTTVAKWYDDIPCSPPKYIYAPVGGNTRLALVGKWVGEDSRLARSDEDGVWFIESDVRSLDHAIDICTTCGPYQLPTGVRCIVMDPPDVNKKIRESLADIYLGSAFVNRKDPLPVKTLFAFCCRWDVAVEDAACALIGLFEQGLLSCRGGEIKLTRAGMKAGRNVGKKMERQQVEDQKGFCFAEDNPDLRPTIMPVPSTAGQAENMPASSKLGAQP